MNYEIHRRIFRRFGISEFTSVIIERTFSAEELLLRWALAGDVGRRRFIESKVNGLSTTTPPNDSNS